MRGSVIALTDDTGNIAETYSYDPFGNLLSTPTIYNPKLYSGRDDVLYDTETDLYYMHARYYDPEIGRFIMKDPVEGSLGSPITQNSYIYCANDPINKIDPAGTVTLGALDNPFKPKPPSKHGPPDVPPPPPKPPQCFSNQCIGWGTLNGLPGLKCPKGDPFDINEHDLPSCKIEGDDLYKYFYDPNGSSDITDDPTSASTVLGGGLEDLTSCGILPDSGIIEQPNKNYDIKYEVDEYGNVKLSAVDKDGNPVELSPEDQAILDNINKGMNDALNWLRDQGFKFNDLNASKKEIMNFISKYAEAFYRITGGETPENAYELAYNATVGLAIACEMHNDPAPTGFNAKDVSKYDQEIGFWTSYWTSKVGYKLNLYTDEIKESSKSWDIKIGLVDAARLMKAVMLKENGNLNRGQITINYDENGSISSVDYGLFQVNDATLRSVQNSWVFSGMKFIGTNWMFDPFINIGAGIGIIMNKAAYSEKGKLRGSPTPTLWHWLGFIYSYNSVKPEDVNKVWKYFKAITEKRFNKFGDVAPGPPFIYP